VASDDQADFHDAKVIMERDKALLVVIEGEEKWVPKSVIHDDSEVFDGDKNSTGTLIVKSWWAKKEGLL
jgi:hypothetical protein